MIAKLLKNFSLWEIDNEAVVDFQVTRKTCPFCDKKRDWLVIRDWRPITEGDRYSFRWNDMQIALVYNEPSPRGRLGERWRKIPSDVLDFDFNINRTKVFCIVTHDGYKIEFRSAIRKYNPEMWHIKEACHIYENAVSSDVLWLVRKDGEYSLDKTFLTEEIEIHEGCASIFTVGCKKFFENPERLIWMDDLYRVNRRMFKFVPGVYEISEIEEKFGTNFSGYIGKFNENSKYFNVKIDNNKVMLEKKQ